MVVQSRGWLPDAVGGVTWYGLDDTDFTCYMPLHCSIDELPPSLTTGSLQRYSDESAWWVFNVVSNYAMLKYEPMMADVRRVQRDLESHHQVVLPAVERTAVALLEDDPAVAVRYLTDHAVAGAERTVQRWRELGDELITRYNDGYVKDDDGRPRETGYPEGWLRQVVEQRPQQYLLPEDGAALSEPTDF